jgi:glucan phosphoethanolaminetransferase (alkaline phosphatase superfamily)
MAKLELYLKDDQGNHSSSRLMAWYFMWFFFLFNILFAGLFLLLAKFIPSAELGNIIPMVIMFILSLDVLVLIAIFAPKQLAKISEVRKIVELAKGGKEPQKNTE